MKIVNELAHIRDAQLGQDLPACSMEFPAYFHRNYTRVEERLANETCCCSTDPVADMREREGDR